MVIVTKVIETNLYLRYRQYILAYRSDLVPISVQHWYHNYINIYICNLIVIVGTGGTMCQYKPILVLVYWYVPILPIPTVTNRY